MKTKVSKLITKLRYTKFFTILKNGLWRNNPVFSMALGICSALAISNRVENAIAMGLGVTFVLVASSAVTSLIRNLIPQRVRLITYMVLIATFVISVDLFLKAFFPVISKALGPYVGLIITNCIIMGRAEAFASKNPVRFSLLDAVSNGMGFMYTLILIAVFREVLAFGTILGTRIMPAGWTNWVVMAMAPGGFFILAIILWAVKSFSRIGDKEGNHN